jgi:hypothetical protein
MKNVSDKGVQEIKTHISRSITFSEKFAVYEILWENTVQPNRPQLK